MKAKINFENVSKEQLIKAVGCMSCARVHLETGYGIVYACLGCGAVFAGQKVNHKEDCPLLFLFDKDGY
jgi:ribosomal protein L37AE/L43A